MVDPVDPYTVNLLHEHKELQEVSANHPPDRVSPAPSVEPEGDVVLFEPPHKLDGVYDAVVMVCARVSSIYLVIA
jgi:hypothetical protein